MASRPDNAIGSYAIEAVPKAYAGEIVGDVLARLPGVSFEDVSHVFVLDADERLAGIARLTDVLASPPTTRIGDLVNQTADLAITLDTDRETAASAAIRSGHTVLPIVDTDRKFRGALSGRTLIRILREEHLEDLHHMAGIMTGSERAQAALSAPPHRRALYRLPWLLVGLIGSALSAAVMAHYEHAFEELLAAVYFIPALVYLADAVGTQSEAVAVRGLSLAKGSFRAFLLGEFATGLLIGLVLSLLAFPLVLTLVADYRFAAAVAVSLFASASLATAFGFALPWIFERLGLDPAHGAGPIGTVIQDLLTIFIYLSAVTAIALG